MAVTLINPIIEMDPSLGGRISRGAEGEIQWSLQQRVPPPIRRRFGQLPRETPVLLIAEPDQQRWWWR